MVDENLRFSNKSQICFASFTTSRSEMRIIMNKISKKGYAILSSILIISIAVSSLCLHFFSKANNSQQISTKGSETDYASIERDTSLSVDSSGVLQISRNERKEEKIMGKENTWTIFMYLCGSNLESQYQAATTDIE